MALIGTMLAAGLQQSSPLSFVPYTAAALPYGIRHARASAGLAQVVQWAGALESPNESVWGEIRLPWADRHSFRCGTGAVLAVRWGAGSALGSAG